MRWEDHVSNDTMKMLDEVKKKHTKHQKLKRQKENYLLLFAFVVILLLAYLYYFFSNVNIVGNDVFAGLPLLIGNPIIFILLMICLFLFYQYTAIAKKEKKEKDKYKKIRSEAIDYLDTHYITPYSNIRDEISQTMEEKFKINLRYKND
ncbi:DUF2663 family protein [Ornithinibacillus halophilus]|uniref:DUF2663 family protein n=1 Tax=Ornithinibacillus halophilus TaxID=930117 RepID=A0A1M5P2W5_9BACI|nr:DUF2663 family protein [Ornithinibacillus halophilus]SHG96166.1 Protein of unknown function [Ornithinibacillus halophilus]